MRRVVAAILIVLASSASAHDRIEATHDYVDDWETCWSPQKHTHEHEHETTGKVHTHLHGHGIIKCKMPWQHFEKGKDFDPTPYQPKGIIKKEINFKKIGNCLKRFFTKGKTC